MRYEITTDKEDLLVLTLNLRVILVTRNMSEILAAIEKDYPNHLSKTRRAPYQKADIKLQAVATKDTQDKPTTIKTTKSNAGSLGKLFNL